MRYLGSVLWFVPFFVHIGYLLATYMHLPPEIGVDSVGSGTSVMLFIVGWFAIVGSANLAFMFLYIRLPGFGDRVLAVPKQDYWLSTAELRGELIDRLRSICDAALFGLNVFFLAVYQIIYQTNAVVPFLSVPPAALVFFFMILPLLVAVIAMLVTIRGLAADARK